MTITWHHHDTSLDEEKPIMATAQQPLSIYSTKPPTNGERIPPQSESLVATPLSLLSVALRNNAAIDVIERLAALQRDERNYQATVAFDEALNRCQAKLTRISADAANASTNSRYATYAKLDATVRPIYTAEGFSLSFGERDCLTPGKTRFVAFLSRAGVTREYLKDVSPSMKGPKGNDVMTPIHADASADSYAKRYLLKDVFNLAIGEDDTDGNLPSGSTLPAERVTEFSKQIVNAANVEQLRELFKAAYTEATEANDRSAMATLIRVKDQRKREIARLK